jgi:hydroxyacylglutathione hydrolase
MIEMRQGAVERVVADRWEQNCYIVTSGVDAVVIDPGDNAEQIVEHIDAARLRLHAILATHGHHDHVGAVAALADTYEAPFAIHSADRRTLARVNLSRHVFHRLEPIRIPPIDIDLSTTTMLRFGHLEIASCHTPGHSPGSVCLGIGAHLFTGDTIFASHAGRTDLPEGDRDALRASLHLLAERYPEATRIWPGHGEPALLGDALARAAALSELK